MRVLVMPSVVFHLRVWTMVSVLLLSPTALRADEPVRSTRGIPLHPGDLRISAMVGKDENIRVGLIDRRTDPPKSYWLIPNERNDGFELLEADYEAEVAKLQVDDKIIWLRLDGEITEHDPARRTVVVRKTPRERMREVFDKEAPKEASVPAVPPPVLHPRDIMAKLRETQMLIIREKGVGAGLMPIPITPELEAELRAAGVKWP